MSLQGRLEDFEMIQRQLEEEEDPEDLENARDSVRRHVETKQQLNKVDLDIACEAVSHTINKLLPCDNPDFTGELNLLILFSHSWLKRTSARSRNVGLSYM